MNPMTDLPQILIVECSGIMKMFLVWFKNSRLSESTHIGKLAGQDCKILDRQKMSPSCPSKSGKGWIGLPV